MPDSRSIAQAALDAAKKLAAATYQARKQAADEARQQALLSAQSLQGAYGGAAQLAAGAVEPTRLAYEGAATQSAAFAKGYSQAFEAAMREAQGTDAAWLQKVAPGSPAPTDLTRAADSLNYTRGQLPAQATAQEGARQTDLALRAPVSIEGVGAQAYQSARGDAERAYGSALREAGATRAAETASGYQSLLRTYETAASAKEKLASGEKLARERLAASSKQAAARLLTQMEIADQRSDDAREGRNLREKLAGATDKTRREELLHEAALEEARSYVASLRDAGYAAHFTLRRTKKGWEYEVTAQGPDGKPAKTLRRLNYEETVAGRQERERTQRDRIVRDTALAEAKAQVAALAEVGVAASFTIRQTPKGWEYQVSAVNGPDGKPLKTIRALTYESLASDRRARQRQGEERTGAYLRSVDARIELGFRAAKRADETARRVEDNELWDRAQADAQQKSKTGVIHIVRYGPEGPVATPWTVNGKVQLAKTTQKRQATYTAAQKAQLRAQALQGAQGALEGWTSDSKIPEYQVVQIQDGKPVNPTDPTVGWTEPVLDAEGNVVGYRNHHPPMSYAEAFVDGLANIGDARIVAGALNAMFPPGVNGRPITGKQALTTPGIRPVLLPNGNVALYRDEGGYQRYLTDITQKDPTYPALRKRARILQATNMNTPDPTTEGLSPLPRDDEALLGVRFERDRDVPPTNVGDAFVAKAKEYLGTPYKWGGESPEEGFDCSGFAQYLYAQEGKTIPRVTYDQWKTLPPVSVVALQPGDLLFFRMGDRGPEHEGIFIGDDQFIHAPRKGDVVKISKFSDYPGFVGARRVP